MTDSDRISGTVVPDTAIHRASLWLEGVKYPGGSEKRAFEPLDDLTRLRFIEECARGAFTAEELEEAARFYGMNWLHMAAAHDDALNPVALFTSIWIDAFMHGAATVAGKHGLSVTEQLGDRG